MENMKKLVLASVALFAFGAAQAQDLPDGKGKDTFVKVCGACHDAGVVVTMHNGKADWQTTVDDMKGRGADASDDDFKTIVDYLAKYQGPEVNMNKASADDLKTQLDLSAAEAAAIVKYRTDNGAFKSYADVQKVPGVDAKKLDPLKGRLTFN